MNIQSLPWLKFSHESYLVSEFKAKASAIAKAAYFDLLCFAMKQSPALSLPNCDDALAGWASLTLDAWQQIKDIVLSQFSLNQDDNRYYSPMLVELYSSPSNSTELTPHNSGELHQIKKRAKTNAERQKEYKERKKGNVTGNTETNEPVTPSNAESNAPVTPSNATGNEKVTASNADFVTFGGIKGGDLDLDQDLNKDFVVVNQTHANKQSAHEIANLATQQQTTKFFMHFDFKIEPSELEPFLIKLDVPMTKHSSHALGNFVSYYVTKSYQNTRDEWIYQYAKWLQREKETPVDKSSPQPTKLAAEFIQPVKPLWETLADKKAQQQAQQPKAESALAASALAQIKKSVGLKAA